MKQDKEPKKIEMGGFGEPQHLLLVVTYTAYLGAASDDTSAAVKEFSTKKLIKLDFATIQFMAKNQTYTTTTIGYEEIDQSGKYLL